MSTNRRAALLALVLASAISACDRAAPAEIVIEWTEEENGRSRPLQFAGRQGASFSILAPETTGITTASSVTEEQRLANRTLSHGTGIALGDMDGDGWVDLYVCRLDGSNALYRNLGGWRFEDVTAASGAGLADRMSRGAVFADADADGDLDLFVAVHGDRNALLLNDGAGRFVGSDAGFEGAYGSTTLALADVDGDGDLDPYFANYKTIQGDDLFSPTERTARGIAEEIDGSLVVRERFREHYRVQRLGERVRRFELADPDEFYLNDGAGRFQPVTFTSGVFLDGDGDALAEVPRVWGLVARFFDFDDDLDPDLYVANDFGSVDGIWANEGGRFRAVGALAVRTTSASSMGVDFADVDRDGDTDFVTTEMLPLDDVRRRKQTWSAAPVATPPGLSASRASAGRNALQLNRGDGTFAEVGRGAGLDASEWTWGAMFLDADLDGYEDLLVTNGHAWNPLDGDTQEDLRSGRITVDWRRELGVFPRLDLRNLAFRNRGDGTFEESGREWGFGQDPDVSHALASADLDRDGDLDIVVTRLEGPPLVLRNDAGGARTSVRLVGFGANTSAIGARVTIEGGAVPSQTRQVTAGGMYLSGSDPQLAFAMRDSVPARLVVTWPGGSRTLLDVLPNRSYEIRETGSEGPASGLEEGGRPEPLFEPVAMSAPHSEAVFDELARQPLIPLELSRSGPGVSWEDVDRDGDPDLLIAAAAGGRTTLLRNDGGMFAPPAALGAATRGDQTTLLGTVGPSGYTVVTGVSNWELRNPAQAVGFASLVDLGASGGPVLAGDFNMAGPVAQADVDADGDLDLFVGGRALPGAYPLPPSSRLLLGGESGWEVDASQTETFDAIGMVSGAVFSDIDQDGDPDLLLALEWGPVRLFVNDAGRYSDATAAWGLDTLPGRWNGIATGDLDADGRPDIVATSWGLNVTDVPSADRPRVGIASDFDANGQIDFIEGVTAVTGRVYPGRDFLTLSAALPFIRRSVPTFDEFSRSTVDDLISSRDASLYRVSADTYAHTVFMNRGNRFEASPLPLETQRAPAFGVAVADLDRDGDEDVYLAQNFLATPFGIDRHDAGRGAILLGDGAGGFEFLDGGLTGAPIYGDARGAAVADFDLDGRWDLAVGQNGESAVVFRGIGGEPGLSVLVRGSRSNPDAIGASIRVLYAGGTGPLRELQSGSGYWSSNGARQVFGLATEPTGLRVRWPGGAVTEHALEAGARQVEIVGGAR